MKKLFILLIIMTTGAYAQKKNELSITMAAGGYSANRLLGNLGIEGGLYGVKSKHSVAITLDAAFLEDQYLTNYHRTQYISDASAGKGGIFTGVKYMYRLADTYDMELHAVANPVHCWPMNITGIYTGVQLYFRYGADRLGLAVTYDPIGKVPMVRFIVTPGNMRRH